ncbi:hypothetical protein F0562_017335 [Nyssa sinensis]|uniref:Uncharacterized protein n=1 Tax=Nyssa sinensis TaxID=561372 RepID=A0A5J4ZHW7_9ASTE|nr:hypothetical protein F0562_017335 [Nyssa sinensis]
MCGKRERGSGTLSRGASRSCSWVEKQPELARLGCAATHNSSISLHVATNSTTRTGIPQIPNPDFAARSSLLYRDSSSDHQRTMSTSVIVVGGCEGDNSVQQPSIDAPSIPPPVSSYVKRRSRGERGGRRVRKPCRVVSSSKVIPLGGEPCLEEAEGENSGSMRRKASKKFLEDDLTPEERAIPDTPLLRNLGNHPSVYARAGRGILTQNLNF